jgi:small conductance mechanosensitive channel
VNVLPPAIFGLHGRPEKLALIGIVIAVTVATFFVIGMITRRLSRRAGEITDPAKWQQRRTALTLLATLMRYAVLISAIGAVISIVAGGAGGAGAIGGSAVVAVTVGLASQRLFTDIAAGFFILFEGQYAVGDTIAVEPSKITGVVEELGVRTTLIREPDGSLSYVPNGQITAVRRYLGPDTTLVLTVVTKNVDAARSAVHDLGRLNDATYGIVGPLGKIEVEEIGQGISTIRVRLGASSTMGPAAAAILVATLKAQPEGVIVGEPSIMALAPASERARTKSRI